MTLPIDLVLVRHGQSEGNIAKRKAEAGDNHAFDSLLERHTATWRLTALGCEQATSAGKWLAETFQSPTSGASPFDRHYASSFRRAMETAALLRIPGATWFTDDYLTERDWGEYDKCTPEERNERFGEALARRDREPFFWRPEGGESFQQLCLRVDRVLHTLHRECSDKRVLIVCHGEVMWAFRVRLERMSQQRFKELHLSTDSNDRMHNCQVLHYTRRSPETGRLCEKADWRRMTRPTREPLWDTGWQKIDRPRYTNEELLALVNAE